MHLARHIRGFLALVLALGGWVGSAVAQEVARAAFPMGVSEAEATAGEVLLVPRLEEIHGLRRFGEVVLTGLALPEGGSVALALRQIDLGRMRFGVRVDGQALPDPLGGLDLSLWKGKVRGEPDSEVFLAFSPWGSRGWIAHGGRRLHLLAGAATDGSWYASPSRLVAEETLIARGVAPPGDFCANDRLPVRQPPDRTVPAPPPEISAPVLECQIAVETDYQLNSQAFGGNLSAEMTYVTTLLGAVSDRYLDEIDVLLSYPYVQYYTDPADPWSTPDTGGDAAAMLMEFTNAWAGNLPAGANLGHFLSGMDLGGGAAWTGVLCNYDWGFGVSGNLDGTTGFPLVQGPANWDFVVMAHELGHNFNAIHTHEYCPPLDECAPIMNWGPCQSLQNCISYGTLMSYCHLCPAGVSNITTWFHPAIKPILRSHAEGSCLIEICDDRKTYCTGKTTTQGLVPYLATEGFSSVSSTEPFRVIGNDFVVNRFGLMLYSQGRIKLQFHGGYLCVKSPFKLIYPLKTANTSGQLRRNFNKYVQNGNHPVLTAGARISVQWYQSDAGNPSGWGDALSNAVRFTICP